MPTVAIYFVLGMLVLAGVPHLQAQAPDAAESATQANSPVASNEIEPSNLLRALASLQASIEAKRVEVRRLESELEASTNNVERGTIANQLDQSAMELVDLERKFTEAASNADLSLFIETEDSPFSWEAQLGRLLKPVLAELENATSQSRVIAELRDEEKQFQAQRHEAQKAADQLETLIDSAVDAELKAQLQDELSIWEERETIARNQEQAAKIRLQTLEAEADGLLDSSTAFVKEFFSSRGLSLVLAILAAVAVFFLIRVLYWTWRKADIRKGPQGVATRVITLVFHLASALGAVVALLLVFNLRGDWFLLGIVLIFLLGVAWASINTLPQYVEAIRIMLNIGAVREGERVIYDGLPWKVDSLGFSCKLVNERLVSSCIRLPVRYMVDVVSRPLTPDECLFPTKVGDWVSLADERIGEVINQDTGMVCLREPGGAETYYQTTDFLAQTPRNLSEGFRIETRFGIDYAHQAICTTEVPEIMEAKLNEALPEVMPKAHIRMINVEFASAAASSLEYEVEVDIDGASAELYEVIEFSLQRILVDACNENNWNIPFTQLTIHNADT